MIKEKYKSVLKLPKTNYHIFGPAGIVFTDSIKIFTKTPPSKKVIMIFKGTEGELFLDTSKMPEIAEYLFSKLKKEPKFADTINNGTVLYARKFLELYKRLNKENLNDYSNLSLFKLWEKGFVYTIEKQKHGFVSSILDYFTGKLTDELTSYLRMKIGTMSARTDIETKVGEYYSILTRPVEGGLTRREKRKFLEIANEINKSPKLKSLFLENNLEKIIKKLPTKTKLLIKKHANKFGRLWYFYDGPCYRERDFYKLLKTELNSGNIAKKLQESKNINKIVSRNRNKIYRELKIDTKTRKFFEIATAFLSVKNIEKELDSLGWSYRAKLFEEIGRRLKIDNNLVKRLLPDELKKSLVHQQVNKSLLRKRFEFSVLIAEKGRLNVFEGQKAKLYVRNFEKSIVQDVVKIETDELKGETAFPGVVKGVVKIINKPKDISKMKEGDILVARLTNPDLIMAMKRSAAIVTDTGGITSHAAITSRELQIPCVIGTKVATSTLKDGDLIEVDASRGIVKILKKIK